MDSLLLKKYLFFLKAIDQRNQKEAQWMKGGVKDKDEDSTVNKNKS